MLEIIFVGWGGSHIFELWASLIDHSNYARTGHDTDYTFLYRTCFTTFWTYTIRLTLAMTLKRKPVTARQKRGIIGRFQNSYRLLNNANKKRLMNFLLQLARK